MRRIGIYIALILTAPLILTCAVPCSAAAETADWYWYSADLRYNCLTIGEPYTTVVMYPEGTSPSLTGIPYTFTEGDHTYEFNDLIACFYPEEGYVDFVQGYIYTFDFEIRITNITDLSQLQFEFAIGKLTDDDYVSEYTPYGDLVYTYTRSNRTYTFNLKVTVNVDENFPNMTFNEYSCVMLQVMNFEEAFGGSFNVKSMSSTCVKAIGENAYYQASLDAINDLPNTEYDFVYQRMPDGEGAVEQIKGDLNTITSKFDEILNEFHDLVNSINEPEPRIYMPKIKIPILDIDLTGSKYMGAYIDGEGYFRPLEYLNSMSSDILQPLILVSTFIRFILLVTFITVGLENMIRIEWWI